VRLVLLTEQTRDFERGDRHRFGSTLRRYVGVAALLMLVVVPPALWLMPDLLRVAYGSKALPATDAARLILLAAAVQVVWGWTKSFPVSIGRPNLRIVAQSVELAALVPALVILGGRWHATGAAAAVLLSVVAFALAWVVIVIRLRREPLGFGSVPPEEVSAG
jgi:O-antigen/teichoic acid export membrane protein